MHPCRNLSSTVCGVLLMVVVVSAARENKRLNSGIGEEQLSIKYPTLNLFMP